MKPGEEPLWRDEFSVNAGEERYVSRRQLAKFLGLTSLGMLAGNLWILLKSVTDKEAALPAVPVARVADVPVGGAMTFRYPGPHDTCLLMRRADDTFVAFSQKCTHLSCAVTFEAETDRLACPCHNGYFSAKDGRVLQGPPPRPLPRITVERRGDEIVATGIDLQAEA
jgi:Rieske Fe-S protein